MINYSTVLRQNPQKPEEAKKAYALAQYTTIMTLADFAKHIADHGCTYDRADIAAILTKAVDCMREKLLDGARIQLGDLGTFAVTLQCLGAATLADFTTDNIKAVNVVWRPGKQFQDLLEDAEFNHVATRDAAQKVVKAQKNSQTSVDITPSTSTSDSGDDSSSTDNGDSSSTDNGDSSSSGTDSGTDSGGSGDDKGLNLG